MRGSEAMGLDRDDLGDDEMLTVRATKFRKSRQLPLDETTLRALGRYQALRGQLCPAPATASLLVSATGARLCHATIQPAFRHLVRQAGIGKNAPRARPVIHGLRHSFAVKTLLGWYQQGQDVQARMPALPAYLGHAGPAATYWYLSATPDLLGFPSYRGDIAYKEEWRWSHAGSSMRISGRVRSGWSWRPGSRSRRSPGSSG